MNNDLNMELIEQFIAGQPKTLTTFEAICQHFYQVLDGSLSHVVGVSYYRLDGDKPDQVARVPSNFDDTLDKFRVSDTAVQITNTGVFIPVTESKDRYGTFSVRFSTEGTDELADINWSVFQNLLQTSVMSLADMSSSAVKLQSDAVHRISLAENDSEISNLLLEFVPESISQVALYRFVTPVDAHNLPLSAMLRVNANREKVLSSEQAVQFTSDDTFATTVIQSLLGGELVVEVEGDATAGKFPTALKDSFNAPSMKSLVMSGLRVSKQLMGVLVIGSDDVIRLDNSIRHNLRVLSDQIGILYENRRLLGRTEVTLMQTQLQYAIINELVSTRSLPEMLRILLQYFGGRADGAGVVEVTYDEDKLVSDARVLYQIQPETDELLEPNISITDYVSLEDLQELQESWAINVPVYFIENTDEDDYPELPVKTFVQQNISSCILIPLTDDNLVTHIFSLNWRKPHVFPEQTRSLLKSIRNQLDIIYQNQQLLHNAQTVSKQLAQQVQVQRALNDLATFAGTNQDERLLIDKGADTLRQVTGVDHVGIMLIDDTDEMAYVAGESPKRLEEDIRIPVQGDIWKRLRQGETFYMNRNDTMNVEGAEGSKLALEAVDVSSSLFLPFIDLTGEMIGSVGLDQDKGTIQLSEVQQETAQLVNAQIVTQLQNLRLLQGAQRLAEQMQQIARFGETVQARLVLPEILQTTLHFARRALDSHYFAITLYDDVAEKLVVNAYVLDESEVVIPPDSITMEPENTVAGKVWQSREPHYEADLHSSPYEHPIASHLRALYAVALVSRGVNRGILELGRTDGQPIREVDRSVLSQLANQLTVALDNSITYQQSQRLAQNKVLANEISLQLQQQLDIDGLLNTTVTELGRALGAKRARIRLGVQQAVKSK